MRSPMHGSIEPHRSRSEAALARGHPPWTSPPPTARSRWTAGALEAGTCPAASVASGTGSRPRWRARSRPAALRATARASATSGDTEAHQLRDHLDEVGATDELDLVPHRPSRGEGVVLLAGVEAEPQALLRPTERFERSAGVARGVLDVDVPRARGAIEARIVQERGAEQQFTVTRDAPRVGQAFGDQ